ncbi:hypothetical protein HOP50_16g77730 [Chloropicon primus]|uniref:Uncharacterized protein n=1 Tax=Chloropicon primus TaxID=1764295 RepID=A0A5B8MXG7_9CHLO|nr:hypothetical protein A3770_16p77450 [Chloropicon primus]UPR04432.1 hypothetical protein HOP50_16g77730 [Chloropicon primus]|mmetsp:Transcript_3223/g.8943  ORF Transcript_3223/g.8943 Transcript_3223/m.8943 type:complete len:106 (-) Transcript_3223:1383-1700(-)|eukprot:QDZ25227.1 hypothetical protein A3770_16p77450 [Chloropicon primus]
MKGNDGKDVELGGPNEGSCRKERSGYRSYRTHGYCYFSAFSVGVTFLTLFSANGILSVLSTNGILSLLSLNSFMSVLSTNSALSVLSLNSFMAVGCNSESFKICL